MGTGAADCRHHIERLQQCTLIKTRYWWHVHARCACVAWSTHSISAFSIFTKSPTVCSQWHLSFSRYRSRFISDLLALHFIWPDLIQWVTSVVGSILLLNLMFVSKDSQEKWAQHRLCAFIPGVLDISLPQQHGLKWVHLQYHTGRCSALILLVCNCSRLVTGLWTGKRIWPSGLHTFILEATVDYPAAAQGSVLALNCVGRTVSWTVVLSLFTV